MPADQLINGVWPEGTKLRLKANRDPSDVNGAWHTEGQMYELEVQAEDDIDRDTGQANHLRLIGCSEVARAPQGVFKPEKLKTAHEQHWQQALRDEEGKNWTERVALLKKHEKKLPSTMRVEVFLPGDITSSTFGWEAATVYAYCRPLDRFRVVYDLSLIHI